MTINDIALTMQPQVGPRAAAHLIDIFGSAEAVFNASAAELVERAEMNPEIARQIVKKSHHAQAEKEAEMCRGGGVVPIAVGDEDYPALLAECIDRPHVIYYKGDLKALRKTALAMVGTRRATTYGQKMSERLVADLAIAAPDMLIVSGLAMGIDGTAHRAALSVGLATVAVLADPVPEVSPVFNARMAEQMVAQGGGLIWENHSKIPCGRANFLQRNRIIAGLSVGTVVVESSIKGGSMNTAGVADSYDRVVMAVPGRACDEASAGVNMLIKSNKARMVCSAEDILAELALESLGGRSERDLSHLDPAAARLYAALPDGEPADIEQLAAATGLSAGELAMALMELEFVGLVRNLPGKRYDKC